MRNRAVVLSVLALIVVVAVYLSGYLPERGRRLAAETLSGQLETRLTAAEARLRTADILGRALAVEESAMRNDFGRASELSSTFFDTVRAEAAATPDERLRGGLNDVLSRRDAVTSALTRADPDSVRIIREIEIRLRGALGYETGSPAAPGR